MDSSKSITVTDALSADDRWLRELARSLARDSALAADAVQETWVAWTRSASAGAPHHGWLRTVLRNSIGQLVRQQLRRSRRERSAIEATAHGESSTSIVERLESQRKVIEAVVALDEPYRTVVLLRFYESLPPREIARRLAIPVATAKTRLARGLEHLRERLTAPPTLPEPNRRPLAVLLPLLGKPSFAAAGLPALGLGVVTMNLAGKAVLGVAAAGLLFSSYFLLDPEPATQADARASSAPVAASHAPPVAAGEAPRVQRDDAIPEAAAQPEAVVAASLEATLVGVRGRLFDASGSALPGIAVTFVPTDAGRERVTRSTASDGSFVLAVPPIRGTVSCSQDGFLTLFESVIDDTSRSAEHVVVAARAIRIAGEVIDDRGVAVENARISIAWQRLVAPLIQAHLDRADSRSIGARTDAAGKFTIAAAPVLPDGPALADALIATHPDLEAARSVLPRADRDDLRIVLASRRIDPHALTGVVLDRNGTFVADAWIAFGNDSTQTDALGRFSCPLDATRDPPREISAVAKGKRGVTLPQPATGWPSHVEIVLDQEPLHIRGMVVDAAGKPRADLEVTLDAGTIFSASPASWTEEFAGEFTTSVKTDDAGRFVVGGLFDRAYVLHVIDRDSLANVKTTPLAAGSENVRIVLDPAQSHSKLRGRVVDRTGAGIPGVQVTPRVPYHVISIAGGTNSNHFSGTLQDTDANGRFELESAPVSSLVLSLTGDHVEHRTLDVAEDFDRATELVIVAERVCSLRVALDPVDPEARFLQIVDAEDARLWITSKNYGGWSMSASVELVEGRTGVVTTSERAAFAVLRRADFSEVRRFAIRLATDRINELTGK